MLPHCTRWFIFLFSFQFPLFVLLFEFLSFLFSFCQLSFFLLFCLFSTSIAACFSSHSSFLFSFTSSSSFFFSSCNRASSLVNTQAPPDALPLPFAFFDAMVGDVKNSVMAEDLHLKGVELSEGKGNGAPDNTSEDLALPSFLLRYIKAWLNLFLTTTCVIFVMLHLCTWKCEGVLVCTQAKIHQC